MRILTGSTRLAIGIGIGVVAAEALKSVLPAFRGLGRPLLKATVKSGLILANDSRFKLAEFREVLADVTAEAKAELAAMPPEPPSDQPFAASSEQAAGIM